MDFKFAVTILNLPKDFSHTSGYIIATPDCGRLWYYGFWEDKDEAQEVCDRLYRDYGQEKVLVKVVS